MKPALLLLTLLVSLASHAQYTYTIKADSVKLTGVSCDSSELILQNHTQAVPGFLFNTGSGRTVFQRGLVKLSNTLYLIGADTLRTSGGLLVVPDIPSLEAVQASSFVNDSNAVVLCTDTARGGLFTLIQSTSFVPDSGTIFKAWAIGANEYFVRNLDLSKGLNALWFGLKRNGSTDNTALLTRAIATASALRTPLYFPAGVYMTSQQSLPSFVTLQGTIMDSTVIRMNAGAPANSDIFYLNDQKDFSLQGLTIDGNASNQTSVVSAALIQCNAVSPPTTFVPKNISIRNVRFYNCSGSGLVFASTPLSMSDIHVANCIFDSIGSYALGLEGVNDVWVENNHFSGYGYKNPSSVSGIFINGQLDTNVNIIHNYALNTTNTADFLLSEATGSGTLYGSDISNNYIDGNYIGGGISSQITDSKVIGNIIYRGQGGSRGGMNLAGNKLIISNNFISNGDVTLLAEVLSASVDVNNTIIISDNYIRDSSANSPGIALSSESGINDSSGLKTLDIHDNLIDVSGSSGNAPGIFLGAFSGVGFVNMTSIHHNRIIGNRGAPCIRITDSLVHDVKLDNNTYIRGAAGIQFDSSNLYHIQVSNENFDSVGGVPFLFFQNTNTFTGKVFFNTPIKDSIFNNMAMTTATIYRRDTTVSANYTASSTDYYIRVNAASGNITITLPSAASFHIRSSVDGKPYSSEIHVKRIDTSSNTVTVQGAGSDTIDGAASVTLATMQNNIYKAGATTSWDID